LHAAASVESFGNHTSNTIVAVPVIPTKDRITSPVATFQSNTLRSAAVVTRFPCGVNTQRCAVQFVFGNACNCAPVAASQTFTQFVRNVSTVASFAPSTEIETSIIGEPGMRIERTSSPVAIVHMRTVLSTLHAISVCPSGEIVILLISR
jgi:hypothetical protein